MHIFKNLNLRRKAACKLCGNFLENHFRHLKLYSNWLEVVAIWPPSEKQKIEVHTFDRATLSGFSTWEFTTKGDLKPRKREDLYGKKMINASSWISGKIMFL